ncbi:oligoendopeptidase F [Loigolactobacillus backii]|uniref:oligoendopeptidase F n=1 Tax=Loigolactobacillus backii TaxID=375175 RepID=UPI0022FDAC56|nr:oligoendopeptidase F [Loigolactobacillus backii]MDA5388105.1 oligoendopeptidase F [Loigolactobacillus backii]MDA5390597.1 oligoendopeptidase F [Loigolactobacillus backii]
MSNTQKLPLRKDIPVELTWDLTTVYPTDDDWEAAYKDVQTLTTTVEKLSGTLAANARDLSTGLEQIFDLYRKLEKVYVYASLKTNQDNNDPTYQAMSQRAGALVAKVSAQTAFVEPEILAIPEDKLTSYIDENSNLQVYKHYLTQLTAARDHTLSTNEESLLAGASDVFDGSSQTFNVLNDVDLPFPTVKDAQGNDVQLSQGVYGTLIESTDQAVRQNAFKQLYKVYNQFRNTLASTLITNVKMHNFRAQAHHYPSARAAAMAGNHIPESVYTTLVDVVKKHLPLLHRYVALRKKTLKLKQVHMYDMYTPLTGEPTLTYTYKEAQQEVLKAVKVLGRDYTSVVEEAYEKRWIDVVENKGKTSGAYSSGMYDTNPYILLNWQNNLNSLYTLIHEMGHSVHSYYTHHNQPYVYGDYAIFVAEIASTTNENLLTDYLLKTQTDPKVRAYVLNYYLDGFKGTIFRQTQFAEFEQFIHTQDANGIALTAESMSDYYGKLNKAYYGPDTADDPEIALEWSRIPHFYLNYYVYQYATGFAAATTLADKIVNGKRLERDAYINYLKSGSSAYPIEIMQAAGVDMTKADYLEKAFTVFEERLTELEKLLAD